MKAPALVQALLLVCIGFGVLSTDLQSEPSLSLKVEPRLCLAPCDVMTTTRIKPNLNNRWLVVQVSGPGFQGSMRQLDGQKTIQIPFKNLSEGVYDVTAVLYTNQLPQKEAGRDTLTVEVHHH